MIQFIEELHPQRKRGRKPAPISARDVALALKKLEPKKETQSYYTGFGKPELSKFATMPLVRV